MTAVDTSVVVAALTQWHEAHDAARVAAHGAKIPAHALVESYSVLTRLPGGLRLAPRTARSLLVAWFPEGRILRPPDGYPRALVERLSDAQVAGGASYDGLVGLTAAAHGEALFTRDVRAAVTYRVLGVPYRLLADR